MWLSLNEAMGFSGIARKREYRSLERAHPISLWVRGDSTKALDDNLDITPSSLVLYAFLG
jgi:hypothetical protein